MYVSSLRAAAELKRRRQDPVLRQKVTDFLGGRLPAGFPQHPVAILPRQLASIRMEDITFAQEAERIGLEPWWPTYLADRYTSNNPDKANYVKFRIKKPTRFTKVRVVDDMNELDRCKTPLGQIVTNRSGRDGQPLSLVRLHAAMRQAALPRYAGHTFDISDWFAFQAVRGGVCEDRRSHARYYYAANLAQFILHAVMFEDYHDGPNAANLAGFVKEVVEPALRQIERELGVQPLIVQFPYRDGFDHYPEAAEAALNCHPSLKRSA